MRPLHAALLHGTDLHEEVIRRRVFEARESVWIATANLKDMHVELDGRLQSILALFSRLARRGVALRILHAELPSRPFRASFDRRRRLVEGGLELKICPRVHFKCVLVDGAWVYLGSANLTGAGLGARHEDKRNFELGFVSEDFELIDRTTALFEAVWGGAECGACRVRSSCPDPLSPARRGAGESPGPRRKGARAESPVRLGTARRLGR